MDIHKSERIMDIHNWIMDIHKKIMDIHKSISHIHNSIMDIHNSIMDIHKWIAFMDIHNSNLWISIMRIMDIHIYLWISINIYRYP